MTSIRILTTLFAFGILLTGCGTTPAAEPPQAETIRCTAAYRSATTQPIEQEETLTFTHTSAEQTAVFTDLIFHAAYNSGTADNERNLRVWVTDGSDSFIYHTTLYQLPLDSGPQNQFVGGHGFTGLNYSYTSNSSSELQYWCEANAIDGKVYSGGIVQTQTLK